MQLRLLVAEDPLLVSGSQQIRHAVRGKSDKSEFDSPGLVQEQLQHAAVIQATLPF